MKKKLPAGIRIATILMTVFLIYTGYTVVNQGIKIHKLKILKAEQEQEIKDLNEEIIALKEEIKSGGTLQFVEKIARDEYGMLKPNEIIFKDKDKLQNEDGGGRSER